MASFGTDSVLISKHHQSINCDQLIVNSRYTMPNSANNKLHRATKKNGIKSPTKRNEIKIDSVDYTINTESVTISR